MNQKSMNFEASMQRLEQIVRAMLLKRTIINGISIKRLSIKMKLDGIVANYIFPVFH